jgi:hypothetical protein
MKTLIIKSLSMSHWLRAIGLTSPPEADQREAIYPSLEKRGKGRFFNNGALLMHSFVRVES